MAYKGDDLDLRTPPSYTPSSGRGEIEPFTNGTRPPHNGSGLPGHAGPEPTIWVDDILLACCNHAFDVALAHRATEVRIEHLLYAITRVDPATEILEANGVRDAGLRRESAMVIASAIPLGATDGSTRPAGSMAIKEALDLASAHAAGFNRAAGVGDLLRVFTILRPDLPGLDLLRRHMSAQPASHPQIYEHEPQVYSPPISPINASNATADIMQDNRLDALEQMVRALGRDIALERQAQAAPPRQPVAPTYTPPPATPARQTYTAPTAPPPSPPGPGSRFDPSTGRQSVHEGADLAARLDALEELIKSRIPSEQIDFAPLDARLNDIELALLSQDGTPGGNGNVIEAVEDLRENFAHSIDNVRHILNERIDKLDQNSSAQFSAVHNEIAEGRTTDEEAGAAISAEIKALSGAAATHAASAERNLAGIRELVNAQSEKIAKLESDNAETRGNFVDELREVHDAIMKLNSNQHTLGESITNLHDTVGTRLAAIETNTSKPLEEIQLVSSNVASLSANMDAMYRATIERYHRRNRFWFWLFGTDDWVGASWPSQTARIEDELRALKIMRKRS